MSKSTDDPRGTILLTDDPEVAAKKIMGGTTDTKGEFQRLSFNDQPGISNMIQVLALLKGEDVDEYSNKYIGSKDYEAIKRETADEVKHFLINLQSKVSKVNDAALISKLESDEKEMSKVANATLLKVQKAVGLRPA